jgi:DNA-binding NarL/FixJ family response regulator
MAVDLCRTLEGGIDLVILDLGMPGMGGHRCLRELKEINPAPKVLIASGYSMNSQVRESLAVGAVGFVGKPYQLKDLVTTVRRVLDA